MKFNKKKLNEEWPNASDIAIDLNHSWKWKIDDNDEITIFQHPGDRALCSSSSPCQIVSKFALISVYILNLRLNLRYIHVCTLESPAIAMYV